MARTNGPIQVWNRGDTIPTDAQGGYAGGDSTAAAVGTALAQTGQALATVDNLSATATELPAGASPTVTVSGPVPNKVINIGVPRGADGEPGAPGMGYEEGQQLLAQNQATLDAAQAAQDAATSSASDASASASSAATAAEDAAGPAATAAAEAIRSNLATDIGTPGTPAYEALVDAAGTISDPQTAGLLEDPTSATGAVERRRGTITPLTVDHAGVQSALDSAAVFGLRAQAAGEYTTDQTLHIKSDCDLSGLTIRYTGTGAAVRIGSTTEALHRLTVLAPKARNFGKVGHGWSEVLGTVGYDLVNLNACPNITLPYAAGFDVGLVTRGSGQGCCYNTVMMGHLSNNRVNQKITSDATGWSNQNVYMNGRLSHNSAEGNEVAGVRHILMEKTPSVPNNNTWINTSIEGAIPEIHAEIAGFYNMFINVRWEVGGGYQPKVHWASGAGRNQILWGYSAHTIVETYAPDRGYGNQILTGLTWKLTGWNASTPAIWLENESTVTGASVLSVTDTGSQVAGDNIRTAYTWQMTARHLNGKRKEDSHDRVRLDSTAGTLSLGNGASAPGAFIGGVGTSMLIGGVSTYFGPYVDGTGSIGGPTGYRFNYIRAKIASVTGAHASSARPSAADAGAGASIFDTTLGKPLWSNGSRWVDATGANA